MSRCLIAAMLCLFPWPLRRFVMVRMQRHEIHPLARIGFSLILCDHLKMAPHSQIGSLTVVKGIQQLSLDPHSTIGNLNWITGFPAGHPVHFAHQENREPTLVLGEHSAITHRHLVDCTDRVEIGKFSTIAGYRTQILTHSIDLHSNRQHSRPIVIADYCFVGTGCAILGGSGLPSYSVLGANSLLNQKHVKQWTLYAGSPAVQVKALPRDSAYFHRKEGFVN